MITIPATYVGQSDATLIVEPADDGSYRMTLTVGETVIASASGFRPGACHDFGTDDGDDDASWTVETFGAFLGAAVESRDYALRHGRPSDDDASEHWDVLSDDASEWADACAMVAAMNETMVDIGDLVERGHEHVARERYGDDVVDDWFRADGVDPDAARTDA